MTESRPFDPAAETDRVIAAVLASMTAPGQRGIIVDSPPGAGKSTLVVQAAADLAAGGETCIIVAQTNNQVDDLDCAAGRAPPRSAHRAAVGHGLRRQPGPAGHPRRVGGDQRR